METVPADMGIDAGQAGRGCSAVGFYERKCEGKIGHGCRKERDSAGIGNK